MNLLYILNWTTTFLCDIGIHIDTMSRRNSSVVGVDSEQARRISVAVPDIKEVTRDANRATESEQNMTLRQGFKLYPKAVGWSVLLSTAIIMEGFDKGRSTISL